MSAQENPFKFGTVVDGNCFTSRVDELSKVRQMISGHNHLALISQCRKTGLVNKTILQTGRPAISSTFKWSCPPTVLPSFS